MRIVFFGSDDFSLAAFRACLSARQEMSLVVTAPPQKKGRGLGLFQTRVHAEADRIGIPVLIPENLKDAAVIKAVEDSHADVFVVSSYGKYIPSVYLRMPRIVSVNVHPSLLPRYRGSSPIQSAILNGDEVSGVSLIEVAQALDAGDIFAQVQMPIGPADDYPSLAGKLARLSEEMLSRFLLELPGTIKRAPQNESLATMTKKITKDDALISFKEDAFVLDRKVRAFRPWPGTYVPFEGSRLSILEMTPAEGASEPGLLLEITADGAMLVAAGRGAVKIRKVQLAGKNPVSGKDFVNGRRLKPGFKFQ